jgi:hypothetical protein
MISARKCRKKRAHIFLLAEGLQDMERREAEDQRRMPSTVELVFVKRPADSHWIVALGT